MKSCIRTTSRLAEGDVALTQMALSGHHIYALKPGIVAVNIAQTQEMGGGGVDRKSLASKDERKCVSTLD